MKRQVAGSRWHRVGLLFLVCLFLNSLDGSTAQLTREQLLDMCANQNRQEALAGLAEPPVILMCNTTGGPVLGGVTWTLQRIGEVDVVSLNTSLPKYDRDAFNQLLIHVIAVADDGLYGCSFTHFVDDQPSPQNRSGGCIYVFGMAKFASCEDTSPCSENVPAVTRSESIVLNVSVDFFRQGASGHNQRVTLLNLYNSTDSFRQFPKYICRNEGSSEGIPCADSGRIVVEQGGSHKFDIVLRITNSTPEDSGTYTAIVEVKNPHTFGQAELFKTFMVTVTEVDCGNLTDPENGWVTLTDTTLDSTATYSCNTGYIRVGVETRTCLTNGGWSHELPVCTLVVCGNLTDPENGRVTLTGMTEGSIATYICNPGYIRVGVEARTCLINGEWSDELPVCTAVDCGNLTDPENGQVILTDTTLGSTAIYSCNPGYTRMRVETRTCLTNGEWSEEPPVCTLDCGNLTDPENGQVTLIDTILGFTATYSCNPGYLLVGVETRTCQINGEWSEESPVCTLAVCGNLTDPENGQVILTDTTEGSTANYSCNPGYTRVGVETRTCQINGEWSDEPPVCTRPGTDDNSTLIIAITTPAVAVIIAMVVIIAVLCVCNAKTLSVKIKVKLGFGKSHEVNIDLETNPKIDRRIKADSDHTTTGNRLSPSTGRKQDGKESKTPKAVLDAADSKLEVARNGGEPDLETVQADLKVERIAPDSTEQTQAELVILDRSTLGRTKAAEGQPPPGGTDETDYPPQVERVILDRSRSTSGSLGLRIVGGVHCINRIFGHGKPGVYIAHIAQGGAAETSGRLRIGDRILSVNHKDLYGATHKEAVRCLQQQGPVTLIVERGPLPHGFQEVTLEKDTNNQLGVSIRGGAKGAMGNPLDSEDKGIFISKITEGGAAEQDGRLRVGQRILEVNRTSLLGLSHQDAMEALRSSPSPLSIIVCHGYNPLEVLKRMAKSMKANALWNKPQSGK